MLVLVAYLSFILNGTGIITFFKNASSFIFAISTLTGAIAYTIAYIAKKKITTSKMTINKEITHKNNISKVYRMSLFLLLATIILLILQITYGTKVQSAVAIISTGSSAVMFCLSLLTYKMAKEIKTKYLTNI